jgi:hypothetical protein
MKTESLACADPCRTLLAALLSRCCAVPGPLATEPGSAQDLYGQARLADDRPLSARQITKRWALDGVYVGADCTGRATACLRRRPGDVRSSRRHKSKARRGAETLYEAGMTPTRTESTCCMGPYATGPCCRAAGAWLTRATRQASADPPRRYGIPKHWRQGTTSELRHGRSPRNPGSTVTETRRIRLAAVRQAPTEDDCSVR